MKCACCKKNLPEEIEIRNQGSNLYIDCPNCGGVNTLHALERKEGEPLQFRIAWCELNGETFYNTEQAVDLSKKK